MKSINENAAFAKRELGQAVALYERQNAVRVGALLVHYNLQMRASDANDSVLSYSKQLKRGEYKQGRMV